MASKQRQRLAQKLKEISLQLLNDFGDDENKEQQQPLLLMDEQQLDQEAARANQRHKLAMIPRLVRDIAQELDEISSRESFTRQIQRNSLDQRDLLDSNSDRNSPHYYQLLSDDPARTNADPCDVVDPNFGTVPLLPSDESQEDAEEHEETRVFSWNGLSLRRALPSLGENSTVTSRTLCTSLWCSIGVALLVLVIHVTDLYTMGKCQCDNQKTYDGTIFTRSSRLDNVSQCAAQLSGLSDLDPASPQYQAVTWFMGPGDDIEVPNPCVWDSDFGSMYALIIVRESLQVKEASWYTEPHSSRCHWKRVNCNDAGDQIVDLIFNNAHIEGSIPDEIAGLVSLRRLHLFSNHSLVGTIPAALGSLTNLESLQLHDTRISGSVPTELGQLVNLQELLLEHTRLEGEIPSEVCLLKSGHDLNTLVADCSGDVPSITCTCCSKCEM